MTKKEVSKILQGKQTYLFKCGSRVTCSPPVMDTDEDWLVFVAGDNKQDVLTLLENDGFKLGGYETNKPLINKSPFCSYVKGDLNLIVTDNLEFCNKFKVATLVSKELNLLKKADRVMLFQAVLYGYAPFAL